jgi:hypothetical protein
MKKILYILLLIAVSTVSFTACTEEVVAPKTQDTTTGGGTGGDPIKP